LDNTTASMVAPLTAASASPAAIGVSLGSPCVGAFVPVWLEAPVPGVLGLGGREPDGESAWWRMRALLDLVERVVETYGPAVRARADACEGRVWREVDQVEGDAASREGPARTSLLAACSARAAQGWLAEVDAIAASLR